MKDIAINKLDLLRCELILQKIREEKQSYLSYFTPFDWNTNDFIEELKSCFKDQYFGLFVDSIPIGFYMLRGFDKGFKVPSYGIWISSEYSGLGFAKLSLNHAHCFCKVNKLSSIMLKVHPENIIAKLMYQKHGYVFSHIDPDTGHGVYYFHFNK